MYVTEIQKDPLPMMRMADSATIDLAPPPRELQLTPPLSCYDAIIGSHVTIPPAPPRHIHYKLYSTWLASTCS